MRKVLFFFFFCISHLILAQNFESTNNATLFGIGSSRLYDTYLSPLEYKGTSLHLVNERMKGSKWFDKKFTKQQVIELEFSLTDNPAKSAQESFFMFDYSWGGHYNLVKTSNFRFSAGALWNTALGVLYNARNSNNPASVRAYSNINMSAIAFYTWKSLTFRWQLDTPVLGVMFSPDYGQSYYQMSISNTDGTLNFASLHNQRALKNYITMDVPLDKITLRIGYLGSYSQTKIHNLQTHTYSNSLMIGLVSESINLSGKKMKNKEIKSSYYE